MPWRARRRELAHGREITWTLRAIPAPEWVVENWPGSATIIAVSSQDIREGKSIDETRYYITSLRTGADALLRHVRQRWSYRYAEDWRLREQLALSGRHPAAGGRHRYREGNGVQIMASLHNLAMNALRLKGFWSITEGLAALDHDIRELLALLGWRERVQALSSA